MEPEGSLPQSQVTAACPYPEPARSTHLYDKPTNALDVCMTVILPMYIMVFLFRLADQFSHKKTHARTHTHTLDVCVAVHHFSKTM